MVEHFGHSQDLVRALSNLEEQGYPKTLQDVALALEDCRILLVDETDFTIQAFGVPLRRARKTLVLAFTGEHYARVRMPSVLAKLLMRYVGEEKESMLSWRIVCCALGFVAGGFFSACWTLHRTIPHL